MCWRQGDRSWNPYLHINFCQITPNREAYTTTETFHVPKLDKSRLTSLLKSHSYLRSILITRWKHCAGTVSNKYTSVEQSTYTPCNVVLLNYSNYIFQTHILGSECLPIDSSVVLLRFLCCPDVSSFPRTFT